jgi:aconitate hydratase 2/2-methylisocitrate dehydratase
MIEDYEAQQAERAKLGIPALPLTAQQTAEVCELLVTPPAGRGDWLRALLAERVAPGVDPAAKVKAAFLADLAFGRRVSPLISSLQAVELLGTMLGGYNVAPLVAALEQPKIGDAAAKALGRTTLVYDAFNDVAKLAKAGCAAAAKVMQSWADAEWFTSRQGVASSYTLKVYKVDGEINTDDFSPASDAFSRSDIPLHALTMGKTRFPDGLAKIAQFRKEGHQVAFVGDVVGTGSSRKSAINSLLWATGEDIPFVPNKKNAGIVIGGAIAPIFYNTAQDSGALPIRADVSKLKTGDVITVDVANGKILDATGVALATFALAPTTLADEFRAGGRIPLIIGRAVTEKARKFLGLSPSQAFVVAEQKAAPAGARYTLAQKIVGKACGVAGVVPGIACEPFMTTVGSQDTTGPMTADELTELACLKFQAPMFMQSFCHTAAYPKLADVKTHKSLPVFVSERGGVSLRPGDGVVHSWLNRLLLPDTVGTGGDSHTRFPIGISFPAGSGLVAFAGAMGFMPLDMPESVLVRFKGKLNAGITLRDVVNAIPWFAIKRGLLTVPKKNKVNVFNGRILEIEGLPELTVEQAFELTDASAERSAAASCIALSKESIATYLRSNAALMKSMIADGYSDAEALTKRIADVEAWLAKPELLTADQDAQYAEVIEIDLAEITEPIVACPNDPDDVKLLSEVAGDKVDDVFLGSCMTNIGHYRAAGEIMRGRKFDAKVRTVVCPPTRMDQKQLKDEAYFSVFGAFGARIETPGCSLCMGNQLRVPDGVTVFSTSTRNFDERMGNKARVYLGSAELGAVVAVLGRMPEAAEYLAMYREKVEPKKDKVYQYLQLDLVS